LPEGQSVLVRTSVRVWFCLAVAVIAAAIADPIVEFASNTGLFGRGSWTDHSNLDVLPALIVGLAALAFFVVLKAHAAYAHGNGRAQGFLRASDRMLARALPRLLLPAFALQLLVLYLMETAEQVAVWGHTLGPTVWLGGPLFFSLAMHAALCVGIAFAISRCVRTLATTTLRVIRLILALATFAAQAPSPRRRRLAHAIAFSIAAPVFCRIGERAPPLSA
jgi:hypothetical protein